MIKQVQNLYEDYPFPSLDLTKLTTKEIERRMAWIPFCIPNINSFMDFSKGTRILDAGCGTGDFTISLGLSQATIVGIDGSRRSIEYANKLKEDMKLKNITFKQDFIDKLDFKEKFDYIFCLGVLHHNPNSYELFQNLLKQLKPNGYIILSLYNSYHCVWHHTRQKLLSFLFGSSNYKDKMSFLTKNKKTDTSKLILYADAYSHPYADSFSVKNIMKWFKDNNLEYQGSFLPIELSYYPSLVKQVIKGDIKLNKLERSNLLKWFDNKGFFQWICEVFWLHKEGMNFRMCARGTTWENKQE